jgi:hypothetical protein
MKRLFLSVIIVAIGTILSCKREGPPGPPGPKGEELLATVYDVTVDFTSQNSYSVVFDFTPQIYTSDLVLVYIRWDTDQGRPIWRLLPQVVPFPSGILQYNFDYTFLDVRLFMEAEFNLSGLGSEWTRNQVFRIVVVPGDFGGKMDYNNYEAVAERLNIVEHQVPMRRL